MKLRYLSASLFFLFSLASCSLFRLGPDLTVVVMEPPASYHPHAAQTASEIFLSENLFDTLVRTSPFSKEPLEGLAESWEAADEYQTFTFVLREDARWSNGERITATDVREAWLSLLDPVSSAPNAWYPIRFIDGAAAYASGATGPDQVAIIAEDPRTLVVRLTEPLSVFPLVVAHHSLAIVSDDENLYSGTFLMEDFGDDKTVILKNRRHPDASEVSIRTVTVATADQLDDTESIAWFLSPSQEVSTELSPLHISLPALDYLLLNLESPLFDDPRVRQALSLSIDNSSLVSALVSHGPNAPARSQTITPAEKPSDAQEAFDLLRQSGVASDTRPADPIGNNPTLQLELLINDSPEHLRLAEELSRQWSENLGLELSVVAEDWPTYLRRRDQGRFQIARAGWLGFYPDDVAVLEPHTSRSPVNDGGFNSLRFDELLRRVQQTAPGPERDALLEEARRLIVEDEAAIIPLFRRHEIDYVDRTNWSGWEDPRRSRFSLRYLNENR